MKRDRAGRAVATTDERAGIVAEDRQHDPAEVQERRGDPLAPIVLALVEKRFHEGASRIMKDGDQQKHRDRRAGNRDALLAEIDLHLRARRRFDAHRRDVGRALRLPHRRHGTLDRPQPDRPSLVVEQPVHDHGVVLGHARIQRLRGRHDVLGQPPWRSHLLPGHDRVAADTAGPYCARRPAPAQSLSNPTRGPPTRESR